MITIEQEERFLQDFMDSDEIKIYLKICQFIKGIDFPYYRAFQFFFEGEYEKCLEYLKIDFKELFLEYSSDDNDVIDIALAVRYMIPFKNAFSGYWDELYKWISDTECTEEIKELCKAVQVFYESDNQDEIKESLEQVFLLNPQRVIVKEYLAVAYYYVGMWGNSVALFEQCDDFYGYYYDEIYFIMAWCYGKLGETVHEIEYYKKSYDMNPDGISTLNNLGYAYYKAKQYNKALEIFSECIDKKIDLKYATNNYVRTLLTMKRFKEAKQFAKNPPAKIAKAFLDRIKKADNTNKRIKADVPLEIETDEFSLIEGKSINKKEIFVV